MIALAEIIANVLSLSIIIALIHRDMRMYRRLKEMEEFADYELRVLHDGVHDLLRYNPKAEYI